MSKESAAINLTSEAKSTFLDAMCQLDEDVAKKLSCHDLDRIFNAMVIPAISRVRHIQRFIDQPHKIRPPIANKTIEQALNEKQEQK